MNTLAELLSSRVKAETFRLLFGIPGRELHVREIERQSGLADATLRQELKRLSRLGLSRRGATETVLTIMLTIDIRSIQTSAI
jgi:DNA-binding HxlR family transcriptional regulator